MCYVVVVDDVRSAMPRRSSAFLPCRGLLMHMLMPRCCRYADASAHADERCMMRSCRDALPPPREQSDFV